MIAKYVPPSLLTTLRMLGTFAARYIAFMYCHCMVTSVKTTISRRTCGRLNSRKKGGLGKIVRYLPKAKRRDI